MPYPKPKVPTGGVKATLPRFVAPVLATAIGKVPSGDRWKRKTLQIAGHALEDNRFDGRPP
jgi:hypothetical protein